MPLLDLTIFCLLLVAAGALILRRERVGARIFLLLSSIALGGALLALWGLRWQAAPVLAVAMIMVAAGACFVWKGVRRPRLVGSLSAMLTLCSVLPYAFFPIIELPPPDGPYHVGVRDFDFRDDTRLGVLYTAADTPRDLPVTVWYPAAASATGTARPYFTRREALDEGRSASALWGFPFYRFLSLHSTKTHGVERATIATNDKFPVVIFNHGYWSYRAQNSALMERLASHGYIVVSVAHPRDGADVRLANGTLIPSAPHFGPGGVGVPALDAAWEEATKAFMGADSHAKRIAALPAYYQTVGAHRLGQSIRAWRDDALFVARTLQAAPPPSLAEVMSQADFSRTIYAGMSFGGSTATSACDADPNCVAAVDLDGENFDAAQINRDIRAPLLLILTDQPFNESQRQEPGFNPTDYAWERWSCSGLRSDVLRLRARGMLHMGMTDLVLSARGPFKSEHFTRLEGKRALALVNDTILAFLERYVRGVDAATLRKTLARYPELERLDPQSLRAYAATVGGHDRCDGKPGKAA